MGNHIAQYAPFRRYAKAKGGERIGKEVNTSIDSNFPVASQYTGNGLCPCEMPAATRLGVW